MAPLALSSGHKLGLGLVAAAFIVFAALSAIVIPYYRPDFPGRWLRAFLVVTVAFFIAMLAAVEIFGAESGEAEGKGKEQATTTAGAAIPVDVSEIDYKIRLKPTTFNQGSYEFRLKNAGQVPHNLTIKGPGLSTRATPTIGAGKSAKLTVALQPGTYELYCSVPGHKQLGMDLKITVK